MAIARTVALVALATALLSGCGTVVNFAKGDPQIYGGAQKDVEFCLTPNNLGNSGPGAIVILGVLIADMGVSLVADTLTLPLIFYLNQHREGNVDGGTVIPSDQNGAKSHLPGPQDNEPIALGE
jgi:uncharacterized protein YceK